MSPSCVVVDERSDVAVSVGDLGQIAVCIVLVVDFLASKIRDSDDASLRILIDSISINVSLSSSL